MPRARASREATEREFTFCKGAFDLSDVFNLEPIDEECNPVNDEVAYTALQQDARLRIVGVFRHARQTIRQRPNRDQREFLTYHGLDHRTVRLVSNEKDVKTDNFIIGIEGKRGPLTDYILSRLRNYFVTRVTLRMFPRMTWALAIDEKLSQSFRIELMYKLLADQVDLMIDEGELWYDEARGIWQLKQTVIDEHLTRRDAARQAVKFDQRPEHGQVRSQRKRRERPSGTSTGEGKNSPAVGRASW